LGNWTKLCGNTTNVFPRVPKRQERERLLPEVFVRINSVNQYQKCRIVNVDPKLDIAVLCIDNTTEVLQSMTFGSSSDLLVGQGLIAIGNPFGLDNSVSTGVVSALNRQVVTTTRGSRRGISNCIQTDCAINPGNSGGPLLNRRGQVVGVNTAILSTSGSSAGIGFAVPADDVQPVVQDMIRRDVRRKQRTTLGVAIWKRSSSSSGGGGGLLGNKNWITRVQPNSPAAKAGMKALQLNPATGCLQGGDAIVAINSGSSLETYADLCTALERCVPGEQLAVTLENCVDGERRVVYLTLEQA
jgi:S1-C subfamily serine protease